MKSLLIIIIYDYIYWKIWDFVCFFIDKLVRVRLVVGLVMISEFLVLYVLFFVFCFFFMLFFMNSKRVVRERIEGKVLLLE